MKANLSQSPCTKYNHLVTKLNNIWKKEYIIMACQGDTIINTDPVADHERECYYQKLFILPEVHDVNE